MVKIEMKNIALILAASLALGCVEDNTVPEGLFPTYKSGGATAVFDLDARPLPRIPFPNDVATKIDPTSPTGKRINVSVMSPTKLEARVRRRVNQSDGFSMLPQIAIEFDQMLDLQNIIKRHQEPVPDFEDDAVYLVNVDEDSPNFGKFILLDMGRGNFPANMVKPNNYFDFDPRANGSNLLFESVQEVDENGNGLLDPLEDTDDDGIWDTPNTLTKGGDPLDVGQMLTFYERETNTLLLRPTKALDERTTYAVVITSKLTDEKGFAVNSPWAYINHTRQTADLEPLRKILPKAFPKRFDSSLKDVRIAWTFTTQTGAQLLTDLRAGLYGFGKFDWLSEKYPATLNFINRGVSDDVKKGRTFFRLGQLLSFIVEALAGNLKGEDLAALKKAFEDVDYFVAGSYSTPYFLVDKTGQAGSEEEVAANLNGFDESESFDINLQTGEAKVGVDDVSFLCMVPKEAPGRKAPFPVVIYGHGYGSSKVESLGFGAQMAKFGLATCAIDNVGHGTVIPPDFLANPLLSRVLDNAKLDNVIRVFEHGRQRDVTNDGVPDSGGDYWSSDTFHTRDIVRQTTIDYMQFIRVLRGFNGKDKWPQSEDMSNPIVKVNQKLHAGFDATGDGKPELAGDFNGDGVVDFGGEQPVYAWGQSLGGIQSAILVAVEPVIRAAAPTAGGAGIVDIAIRSTQGGVPQAVILPMLGPIVLGRELPNYDDQTGESIESGRYQIEILINNAFQDKYVPVAIVEGLKPGDKMILHNLNREKNPELVDAFELSPYATVRKGGFRIGVAADALTANSKRRILGFDATQNVENFHDRVAPPFQGLNARFYYNARSRRPFTIGKLTGDVKQEWEGFQTPHEGMNPKSHKIVYDGIISTQGEKVIRASVAGRLRVKINGERIIDIRNSTEDVEFKFKDDSATIEIEFFREGKDGSFSLAYVDGDNVSEIPAKDLSSHIALTAAEKTEYEKHRIEDPRDFGDPLVIEFTRDGESIAGVEDVSTFQMDAFFQNIHHPKGAPLALLNEGWGQRRQSPSFRRFLGIAQMVLDPADPGIYARNYFEEPLTFPYESKQFQDGGSNVLVIPTVGDPKVPIATEIGLARIGGIINTLDNDPRYGMTANQFLTKNFVYEAIPWLDRFPKYPNTLFDIDDLDRGEFRTKNNPDLVDPNPDATTPFRATVETPYGMSGMRIPYVKETGDHGFFLPTPSNHFDIDSFMANQIGYYFATGGKVLSDDLCLEDLFMTECDFYDYDSWTRPDIQ